MTFGDLTFDLTQKMTEVVSSWISTVRGGILNDPQQVVENLEAQQGAG